MPQEVTEEIYDLAMAEQQVLLLAEEKRSLEERLLHATDQVTRLTEENTDLRARLRALNLAFASSEEARLGNEALLDSERKSSAVLSQLLEALDIDVQSNRLEVADMRERLGTVGQAEAGKHRDLELALQQSEGARGSLLETIEATKAELDAVKGQLIESENARAHFERELGRQRVVES